jgi:hypothetical protein
MNQIRNEIEYMISEYSKNKNILKNNSGKLKPGAYRRGEDGVMYPV